MPISSGTKNRELIQAYHNRAKNSFATHDFLFQETSSRLADHLSNIRKQFPLALDLGCRAGTIARSIGKIGGIIKLIQSESSESMAQIAQLHPCTNTVIINEEYLPFIENCFDLVLSNLTLHSVSNLFNMLTQIRKVLKPNGLFLASLMEHTSLTELSTVFHIFNNTIVTPKIYDISNITFFLKRSGFELSVIDYDTIIVNYENPLQLLLDLRGMGEYNTTHHTVLDRKALQAITNYYHTCYTSQEVRYTSATFRILYLIAWVPN